MAPKQKRHRCLGCRREFVWRPDHGPWADQCVACGSTAFETFEFEGLFDSDTPADILERAGVPAPTAEEEAARAAAAEAHATFASDAPAVLLAAAEP